MNKIYITSVENVEEDFFKSSLELFDEPHKKKINSYKIQDDRFLSIAARIMERKYLPNMPKVTKRKKPTVEGAYFNVSHCFPYVILGLSEQGEIGVDIEMEKELSDKMKEFCFNPDELTNINPIMLWTIKEAFLKFKGKGIRKKLRKIHLKNIDESSFIYRKKKYFYKTFLFENYYVTIVAFFDLSNYSLDKVELENLVD